MPSSPLTHHQILGLVEPFSRSGRQVDLAASQRLERRLQFKPRDLPADGADAPTLTESLQLECHESGHFRLTRTLSHPSGLQATLQGVGPQAGVLLALVDAVPAALHFATGPGHAIARSYELAGGSSAPVGNAPPPMTFSRGVLQTEALTLTLGVLAVKGVAGDLSLHARHGEALALPEDLLAVMGWNWARLVPNADGWTSKLRLRGRGAQRRAAAERALAQAGDHLVRVMAEPPAAYHQRMRGARWGVVLRRAIPTLTALGLVGGALLLPRLAGQELSGVWMALHYVPIAILGLSFTLQELPRFEIPPLPRRSAAASWRRSGAAGAPGAAPLTPAAAEKR